VTSDETIVHYLYFTAVNAQKPDPTVNTRSGTENRRIEKGESRYNKGEY
jgi:hypothetical protein